jgi:hypothetical protein
MKKEPMADPNQKHTDMESNTDTPKNPQPPSSKSPSTPCSLLCDPGYYIAKWGFDYQPMRIRRRLNGLVKHNHSWETEEEWLSRNPTKIERPTLWDRIGNIL